MVTPTAISRVFVASLACDGRKHQKTTIDQQQEILGTLHPTEDGHHETPRNMSRGSCELNCLDYAVKTILRLKITIRL